MLSPSFDLSLRCSARRPPPTPFTIRRPIAIGAGLRVAAVADDGSVEAVEDPNMRFTVGVLWHPEESDEGGAPLFQELVARARDRRRATA